MESVVVAFVNDRVLRAALGFPVDKCLKLRIPPCSVMVSDTFRRHLTTMYALRRLRGPTMTLDEVSGTSVSVKFWWRFERLTMKVLQTSTTKTRYHYMYPFTGEYVMTESP